jgi:hypothetical protein
VAVAVRIPYAGTLKVLAVLGVVGVFAFDGISIGLCHISTQDDANAAARDAQSAWGLHHDLNAAFAAAKQDADRHGEVLATQGFSIDRATGAVTLQLSRTATTVVLGSVHKTWTAVSETGEATNPT